MVTANWPLITFYYPYLANLTPAIFFNTNGLQNLKVWAVRTCQGQPRSSCRPGPCWKCLLWAQRLRGQALGFQSWLHPVGADNWNTLLNLSVPQSPPPNYKGIARPTSQDGERVKHGRSCLCLAQVCVPSMVAPVPAMKLLASSTGHSDLLQGHQRAQSWVPILAQ